MKKYLALLAFGFCGLVLTSCKTLNGVSKPNVMQAMVKALNWQEANPIAERAANDWTNGAYYTGVSLAHQATQNPLFLDALTRMALKNSWQPLNRFYHADDMAICYSYLYLNSLKVPNVNLQPTESRIEEHLNKPYPWKEANITDKKERILWWWCDALFMAPPVLTAYAKLKNDNSYLVAMDKYYEQTYHLLYDRDEHLFARDTRYQWTGAPDDMKEKNGKKIFWSRGNGWVLAGLALILQDMPTDYPNRKFYEDLFIEMAASIKALQPADGLWRTSLLSPASFTHGEVSGSGFFTFALAWGINHGLLSSTEYKPVIVRAWIAIAKCQQSNGKVGWVQNIGADPQPADADSWQNFGTGAFLLAGSEILRLK